MYFFIHSIWRMDTHRERADYFTYTWDELLVFQRSAPHSRMQIDILEELLRPYRVCTARSKSKAKMRCYKSFIPFINIMGNIRFLGNKMDEIKHTNRDPEFWEHSALCFFKTWLHEDFRIEFFHHWLSVIKGSQKHWTEC